MFVTYFLMGVLFTYVAFLSIETTVWNPLTIGLLLVAALDFFVAFRTFQHSRRQKK